MRVLVTGGAGFIGSHVVDALLERGHEVVALDDLSSGRRENVPADAVLEVGDIRDEARLREVFAKHQPELVSHQAAQVSVAVSTREPVRDAEVNVLGTLKLLSQCVLSKVQRVVFASTGGAIYGEVADGLADVTWMPRPLSPYACAKLAVEGYLRAFEHMHGLRSTVLRYANVYGPRQDPHGEAGVVAIFCRRLLDGSPIQINARRHEGDEGCVRDYVYVADVVRGNVMAVEGQIAEPIVNVCTGIGSTTTMLARELSRALGKTPELRYAGPRPGDVERSVLEGSELLRAHPAVPLDEGLRLTAQWFQRRTSTR